MAITDPLVLDLVEWVSHESRRDGDVIDVWRSSCPRLTVWEEAVERGLVERRSTAAGTFVVLTPRGRSALAAEGRLDRRGPAAPAVAHPTPARLSTA